MRSAQREATELPLGIPIHPGLPEGQIPTDSRQILCQAWPSTRKRPPRVRILTIWNARDATALIAGFPRRLLVARDQKRGNKKPNCPSTPAAPPSPPSITHPPSHTAPCIRLACTPLRLARRTRLRNPAAPLYTQHTLYARGRATLLSSRATREPFACATGAHRNLRTIALSLTSCPERHTVCAGGRARLLSSCPRGNTRALCTRNCGGSLPAHDSAVAHILSRVAAIAMNGPARAHLCHVNAACAAKAGHPSRDELQERVSGVAARSRGWHVDPDQLGPRLQNTLSTINSNNRQAPFGPPLHATALGRRHGADCRCRSGAPLP